MFSFKKEHKRTVFFTNLWEELWRIVCLLVLKLRMSLRVKRKMVMIRRRKPIRKNPRRQRRRKKKRKPRRRAKTMMMKRMVGWILIITPLVAMTTLMMKMVVVHPAMNWMMEFPTLANLLRGLQLHAVLVWRGQLLGARNAALGLMVNRTAAVSGTWGARILIIA